VKFGLIEVEDAIGAVAVHSVRAGGITVKKGSCITAALAECLKREGVDRIVAVRLEPDDVGEDEAAQRLAQTLAGENVVVEKPFTGRSNLYAEASGILVVDKSSIDGLNAVDEAITAATLPAYKPVIKGEMIGTVKIIPYAVPHMVLQQGLAVLRGGALRVAPYACRKVGVISTVLPGMKHTIIDKTINVLSKRLEPAGARVIADRRIAHDTDAVADELLRQAADEAEIIIVFGASAIADRRDVIPAAVDKVGGHVESLGMPVDPGNLLLVGSVREKPVIGAPGCARSAKENGFDWVLQRILAKIPVTRADIHGLGVGGLLMEIFSRPQPRAGGESKEEA
jgi:molybdenum cofactor cytidylyltransferase